MATTPAKNPAADESPATAEPVIPGALDPRAAIADNYSHWRATGQILVGGSPAFQQGHPVNDDHPMLPEWIADGAVEPVTDDARKAFKAGRPVRARQE